jgi:hypothetical protein
MNNGDFKQLVRTLRNWKNEGVQIKKDITVVSKRGQGKKSNIQQKDNNNIR